MPEVISVTEAARNFSDVVNKVFYRGESLELTRGGRVVARLVPAGERDAPTGRQLAREWASFPHLDQDEADAFADDIQRAREVMNQTPSGKWD